MIYFCGKNEHFDAVTHGGSFHADDVFSMVLVNILFNNQARILRLPYDNDIDIKSNSCIVFDILGGKFDHHQKGGNGFHKLLDSSKKPIPNASFGLLWDHYGRKIIRKFNISDKNEIEFIFNYIEYHLVRGVDSVDNGIFPSHTFEDKGRIPAISAIISMLNSEREKSLDDENRNLSLKYAVSFATKTFDIIFKDAVKAYQNKYHFTETYMYQKSPKYKDIVIKTIKRFLLNHIDTSEKPFKNVKLKDIDLISLYIHTICDNHFSREDSRDAYKYLANFFFGLIYDCYKDRDSYCISKMYDRLDIVTLNDIFSVPRRYGANCENDLIALLNFIFKNILETCFYKISSKNIIEDAIKAQPDSHILVLDEKVYWQDYIAKNLNAKNVWFVISPTDSGSWKIQPIPCKYNENGYRKGFPSRWYGYDKNLNSCSKMPEGINFIHSQGILAISTSKEDAIKLCEKAYGNIECRKISEI